LYLLNDLQVVERDDKGAVVWGFKEGAISMTDEDQRLLVERGDLQLIETQFRSRHSQNLCRTRAQLAEENMEARQTAGLVCWNSHGALAVPPSLLPSGGPLSPTQQKRKEVQEILATKKANLEVYQKELLGGDAAALEAVCTEDCTFQTPGAPPMPLKEFRGLISAFKASFPDWTQAPIEYGTVAENADGTLKIYTQQIVGLLKADIPAVGPFPAVSLEDASERSKTKPMILPQEIAIVTFDEKSRISSMTWTHIGDPRGATTMDIEPAAGMVTLYTYVGAQDKLPAPQKPIFYSDRTKEQIVNAWTEEDKKEKAKKEQAEKEAKAKEEAEAKAEKAAAKKPPTTHQERASKLRDQLSATKLLPCEDGFVQPTSKPTEFHLNRADVRRPKY